MPPLVHELKTDPDVFQAVWKDEKPYEIRNAVDRAFSVRDVLILKETQYSGEEMKQGKPLVFTGRTCRRTVSHIMRGPVYGLQDGWIIMGFESESYGPNYKDEKVITS